MAFHGFCCCCCCCFRYLIFAQPSQLCLRFPPPPPTLFYKTTEGIITMASACVVVLLAVVTVLLWRKHAKKRYEMKTPWHYTINCPISVDGSFPYGVTEDFIRIYKNMAVMLVILLTLGYCFPGFSSLFGILNNIDWYKNIFEEVALLEREN